MNRMKKIALACSLAAAVSATPLQAMADEAGSPLPSRERGMAWGGVIGALFGGPVGAIVGATGGTLLGHQRDSEQAMEQTREELAEARQALQDARLRLAAAEEAKAEFAAFAAERDVLDEALFGLARGIRITYPFRTGSDVIEAHVRRQIEQFGRAVAAVPELQVRVEGFADVRGDEAGNRELSRRRADAVAAALQALGVDGERLVVVGSGEGSALAGREDAEGWFFDRRVVVSLGSARR